MSDTDQPKPTLDPMSARPLYVQLADVIAQKIASGELAPDRPIPSENHLADEYGVARLTARRAAQELRERGLHLFARKAGRLALIGSCPHSAHSPLRPPRVPCLA